MTVKKERRTLTLDSDVLQAFAPGNLSGEVNEVLREELARREARSALAAFVAGLDAEFGQPAPELV
ncbi:MAG: type II toxin-antitoxin system CcdA family antitoxin, partial [Bifidobacteriaceae bacterium]|nr:type II toxin-antitoxin system CcdA family antitoxin [Bifidobacteriaceae bacterium]